MLLKFRNMKLKDFGTSECCKVVPKYILRNPLLSAFVHLCVVIFKITCFHAFVMILSFFSDSHILEKCSSKCCWFGYLGLHILMPEQNT